MKAYTSIENSIVNPFIQWISTRAASPVDKIERIAKHTGNDDDEHAESALPGMRGQAVSAEIVKECHAALQVMWRVLPCREICRPDGSIF